MGARAKLSGGSIYVHLKKLPLLQMFFTMQAVSTTVKELFLRASVHKGIESLKSHFT